MGLGGIEDNLVITKWNCKKFEQFKYKKGRSDFDSCEGFHRGFKLLPTFGSLIPLLSKIYIYIFFGSLWELLVGYYKRQLGAFIDFISGIKNI